MRWFEHAGLKLAYDVVGAGLPVVLHTGLAGNSQVWREAGYVAGLAEFQVLLLDHRGHGRSEAPSDPHRHTVADYVGDVIALADELGFDGFAFWGYSDGARVGYELAATQPGGVLALVAAGGVDAPDEGPAEWHEAAGLVREHGMRSILGDILGDETVPAWVISQLVDESDPEVVARQLECFAGWTPVAAAREHRSAHPAGRRRARERAPHRRRSCASGRPDRCHPECSTPRGLLAQ